MRLVVVAVVCTLAACLEPALVPCGDRLCPGDRVCHAPTQTCEYRSAIDACDGKADTDSCSFQDVAEGLCDRGRCRGARCGDQIVDPVLGEVCDDGNDDNGDMCSADCRSLEDCGNAVIDQAAGEQCDDGNRVDGDGCQGSCRFPFCGDRVIDASLNEACDDGSANANTPDTCRIGCQLPRCGDGVQDVLHGEVCDDANLIAGDGCRPDCLSSEICGNGIVDFATGELCDDGNDRVRDGCSACTYEVLRSRVFGANPLPRQHAAMTYDAARERLVMFGGSTSIGYSSETWEWDGVSWILRPVAEAPSPRIFAAMEYDAARQRVILFGGQSPGGTALGDTWEWDGLRWTLRLPTTRPPARRGAGVAYDSVRERIVVHGGYEGQVPHDSTWEWNGTTWTQVPLAVGGSPLGLMLPMTYDPIRHEVVLVTMAASTVHTWTFDGAGWTERFPVASPANVSGYAMAFDPGRGRVVLTGEQTWEWDGTIWTRVADLPARIYHMMAYDVAERAIVVHGGYALGIVADTRRRDGTTWSDVSTPVQPPRRSHASAAYDPVRDRVVLFGGRSSSGYPATTPATFFDDTWEWDGKRWREIITSTRPAPRSNHALGFDGAQLVLSGGRNSTTGEVFGDVWRWDGNLWSPGSAVDPRWGHAVAYDAKRGRLVVLGGAQTTDTSQPVDGTSAFASGAWSSIAAGITLSPYNHAMAFDPLRDRIVQYGGGPENPYSNDSATWEFDGATWLERQTACPPRPRREHSLMFDPRRGRVVLFGDSQTVPSRCDVWEWTGATWVERVPVPAVPARYRATTVMQPSMGQMIVFGGRQNGAPIDQTVLLGYEPNTLAESCTASTIDYDRDGKYGCADEDCQFQCAPLCTPGTVCTTSPRCGDATCDPAETCRLCPSDCGACSGGACGDFYCDPAEDATSCPADC